MNKMVDMHTHIIPGVDDGSQDISTTLRMIQMACEQGITHIFATSHSIAYLDEDLAKESNENYEKLKEVIKKNQIPIQIYQGCELYCTKSWMDRLIDGLNTHLYPTINHTRYVLIEFSIWNTTKDDAIYCSDHLLEAGYYPVFAHIERYADLFADMAFIAERKEKGCLFQINYYSLFEEEDITICDFARDMVQSQYADFLGSDCHNLHHRPPVILSGADYLRNSCPHSYLKKLFYENARDYFNMTES